MSKTSAIKAIVIEVLNKDELSSMHLADKISRGPYAGLFIRDGKSAKKEVESYVTMFSAEKNEKALDIYNIQYYNIVTVEIRNADCTDFWYYGCSEEDQKAAFVQVAELLAEMQDVGRVLDDKDLIDVSTYDKTGITGKVAGTHVNTRAYGASNHATGRAVYGVYRAPARTTSTKPAEPKMKVIKRKRGCTKKLLATMYDMVQAIANKDYEAPDLPKAPKEDEDISTTPDTKKDDIYGDNEYNNWYAT